MINPEKLIDSVKQVYGEAQYKELYGDILAIPSENSHRHTTESPTPWEGQVETLSIWHLCPLHLMSATTLRVENP